MNELTIFIFDAEEGMELSRDVILNDGSVLLTKELSLILTSFQEFQDIIFLKYLYMIRLRLILHR